MLINYSCYKKITILTGLSVLLCFIPPASDSNGKQQIPNMEKFDKTALKERLTPLQYHVTQEAGTERPYTGKYTKFYEKGMYVCVVCHQELFSSDHKYDSGCGWPG